MYILKNPIGFIHILSAIVALITSVFVLFNIKGTRFHKRVGYGYVVSMLVLNVTSLLMYNLNGRFNMFHIFALVSLITLGLGMYFPLFARHKKNWDVDHLKIMGWSVVGLYAALAAEIGVRLFNMRYFWMVVLACTLLIVSTGAYLIYRHKKLYLKEVESWNQPTTS